MAVEEGVPEGAVRVQPGHEPAEVVHPRVAASQAPVGVDEELAPVRARREGGQRLLDRRQQRLHLCLQRPPGEVQADAVAAKGHGQPQLVGGDAAHLADQQDGCQQHAQPSDRLEGGRGVAPVDEPLALQLLARARHELQPEVRQPLVPRAGHAELHGGALHVPVRQRVQGRLGGDCAERRVPARTALTGADTYADAALAPHLCHRLPAPVGEQADAVSAAEDTVHIVEHRRPRQSRVHLLHDVVRRLDLERQRDDDAQRAEPDDRAGQLGVGPGERQQAPIGCHQLEAGHRRREVGRAVTRPVRGGRDGARDRDVRQGRQVVQGPAASVQLRGQLAVAHGRADPDRPAAGVEVDQHRQRVQAD